MSTFSGTVQGRFRRRRELTRRLEPKTERRKRKHEGQKQKKRKKIGSRDIPAAVKRIVYIASKMAGCASPV